MSFYTHRRTPAKPCDWNADILNWNALIGLSVEHKTDMKTGQCSGTATKSGGLMISQPEPPKLFLVWLQSWKWRHMESLSTVYVLHFHPDCSLMRSLLIPCRKENKGWGNRFYWAARGGQQCCLVREGRWLLSCNRYPWEMCDSVGVQLLLAMSGLRVRSADGQGPSSRRRLWTLTEGICTAQPFHPFESKVTPDGAGVRAEEGVSLTTQ